MSKFNLILVLLVLITFFSSITTTILAQANISGVIYDEEINPASGAIVKLEKNEVLYSQIVTNETGSYFFTDLPFGIYLMNASLRRNNEIFETIIRLNLSDGDDLKVDIILFEEYSVDVPEIITDFEEADSFEIMSEAVVEEKEEKEKEEINLVYFGFIFAIFIAIIAVLYFWFKKSTEEMKKEIGEIKEEKEEKEKVKENKQPIIGRYLTDEEKIYQLIQRRKELPQSDIVIETGFSKAKVSLILKKLEKMGRIKREIIGRKKIIKIVE